MKKRDITTLSQLNRLAQDIARRLKAPAWVYLTGDLGAGKTTFAQHLIAALGYPDTVKSPTYALMEHYQTPAFPVLHMDLYRLSDPEELHFLGLDDALADNPVVLVEWPERGAGVLPPATLALRFSQQGRQRTVEIDDPLQLFSIS